MHTYIHYNFICIAIYIYIAVYLQCIAHEQPAAAAYDDLQEMMASNENGT